METDASLGHRILHNLSHHLVLRKPECVRDSGFAGIWAPGPQLPTLHDSRRHHPELCDTQHCYDQPGMWWPVLLSFLPCAFSERFVRPLGSSDQITLSSWLVTEAMRSAEWSLPGNAEVSRFT